MDYFNYKDGELHCESIPLSQVAKEVGTPTYVYSKKTLTRHCQRITSAFSNYPTLACFAVKANSNLTFLSHVFKQGFGADVVSIGELERALKAGAKPSEIVFSGVGKQSFEIKRAIEVGILSFNVESPWEIELINSEAKAVRKTAQVSLRVNPNIDAKTNPYISTGLFSTKFGLVEKNAQTASEQIKELSHVKMIGIACHIGSQITEIAPFQEAVSRMLSLAKHYQSQGHELKIIDLGGGLGIKYDNEAPPEIEEYAETLVQQLKDSGLKLIIEPGRVIAGNTGILLAKVIGIKTTPKKRFVILDAAMNDLARPSLYKSYHDIIPIKESSKGNTYTVDFVGPICESGDFLGLDRKVGEISAGDLIAIRGAGAYSATMASNYNSRPRAPEVWIDESKIKLARKREPLEQLWALESIHS